MNADFDLCEDDGTSAAFFEGASVGMTAGTAVEVACSDGHTIDFLLGLFLLSIRRDEQYKDLF